jgi:hypothetical protein
MASNNRYFYDATKLAITAGTRCLQEGKGHAWTLRDLINLFETKEDFQFLLYRYHPRPQHFDEFLKDKKLDRNEVLTTVKSILEQYSLVAARWEHAKEKFSWQDWIQDEYLLVFGSDHLYQDTIKKTNTLLFRFGAACLNNLSTNSERRVWIFIDEATAAGKLIQLETVLALGRSAGVCVVIAFQNVAGFIQEYGERLFKSIFGLCRHKVFFPMDSDSAKYISDYIGEYEYVDRTITQSVSDNASGTTVTTGTSERLSKRPTLLPQLLMDTFLPQPGPDNGLMGYFLAPGEGIHYWHYSWDEIQSMRAERLDDIDTYCRVDDESPSLSLTPWSSEERQQLGLPPLHREQPSNQPQTPPPLRRKARPKPKPRQRD